MHKSNNVLPKSVFYGLLAVSMAVLAADFLFVYIPFSGWILQAVLVAVYLEYLGFKKTILIVAILELFFIASYGGAIAIAAILNLVGAKFFAHTRRVIPFGFSRSPTPRLHDPLFLPQNPPLRKNKPTQTTIE